jgi:hypothetical protein
MAYPFIVRPEHLPPDALACFGKYKAFVDEFVFYQVNEYVIDVLYGGEMFATWTGTEWTGPIREHGEKAVLALLNRN